VSEQPSRPLSQSRLGDYARCPRYYEYKQDWQVTTPDDTIRYRRRGTALHGAIEDTWLHLHPAIEADTLAEDDPNPIVDPMGELPVTEEAVQKYALEAFAARWDEHVPREAYRTDSHHDFDRKACSRAIAAYFGDDGPGCVHLAEAIGSEAHLAFRHDGLYLHGLLDLIRRTEAGLHVVDFKSSLSGIISTHPYWGPKAIEEHRNGESHNPRYMKSLMQAALYRRAARELDVYEEGMEVAFSFYGLRDDVEARPDPDGVVPEVRGQTREMTAFLDDHHDDAWALIHDYASGIRAADFEPEPWDLINDNVCPDCPYREMCPEYLAEEVTRVE